MTSRTCLQMEQGPCWPVFCVDNSWCVEWHASSWNNKLMEFCHKTAGTAFIFAQPCLHKVDLDIFVQQNARGEWWLILILLQRYLSNLVVPWPIKTNDVFIQSMRRVQSLKNVLQINLIITLLGRFSSDLKLSKRWRVLSKTLPVGSNLGNKIFPIFS